MGRCAEDNSVGKQNVWTNDEKLCRKNRGRRKKTKLPTKTHIKGPTILLRGVVCVRRRGCGEARWIRVHSDIYDLDALM